MTFLEYGEAIFTQITNFIIEIPILITEMDATPSITPWHIDYAISKT